MLIITIQLAAGLPNDAKQVLLSGVRAALLAAFSLPEDDCYALLEEFPRSHMAFPPEAGAVLVTVQCFSGRTPEQKADFYRLAAEAVDRAGLDGGAMVAVLHEAPLQDWGICGGRPAAEVLGERI